MWPFHVKLIFSVGILKLFVHFNEKEKHMKIGSMTEACNIDSVIRSTIYNSWLIFNSHITNVKNRQRTFHLKVIISSSIYKNAQLCCMFCAIANGECHTLRVLLFSIIFVSLQRIFNGKIYQCNSFNTVPILSAIFPWDRDSQFFAYLLYIHVFTIYSTCIYIQAVVR